MANLSAKELSAIQDHLGVEQNLIKKYNMFAQASSDECIRTKFEQIASRHQQHYHTLLSHLS